MTSWIAMWIAIFAQVDAQIDSPYYEYCAEEVCYVEYISESL